MGRIYCRQFLPEDTDAVGDICYRTGFLGKDLEGTGRFNDRKLVTLAFCRYYLEHERENCFVAVDEDGEKVIGYIIGTTDTLMQQRRYVRRMYWRIALRMLLVTWWKYPESIRKILEWTGDQSADRERALAGEYPAHLHINIYPDYQRSGAGTLLILTFEQWLKSRGIRGIHLVTSRHNDKAMPFYQKHGYALLDEFDQELWDGVAGQKAIIFGKRFAY